MRCKDGQIYSSDRVTVEYPKENVKEGNLFREVEATWGADDSYEIRLAIQGDPSRINEWETKLVDDKSAKLELGSKDVKGKSCSCATKEDVQDCLLANW